MDPFSQITPCIFRDRTSTAAFEILRFVYIRTLYLLIAKQTQLRSETYFFTFAAYNKKSCNISAYIKPIKMLCTAFQSLISYLSNAVQRIFVALIQVKILSFM